MLPMLFRDPIHNISVKNHNGTFYVLAGLNLLTHTASFSNFSIPHIASDFGVVSIIIQQRAYYYYLVFTNVPIHEG